MFRLYWFYYVWQAGIDPPYILVAHSIGGLEAAMFTANYKNNVQGVVLLDCTSPEIMLSYKNSVPLLNRLFPAMRTVGLLRLINAKEAAEKPFPPDIPVSMIVAVQPGDENYPQYQEFMERQAAWVNQLEKGRLYTLTGRHYIHHYAPDDICDIIISMAQR